MKKKKLTVHTNTSTAKSPSKKKMIWTSILIALVSALAFAGFTLLLTILSVTCALNMGCNSEQDFQLTFGIIAYVAFLIASIVTAHKSTKVSSWLLLFAWICGIALFFAGGWTWMKVDSIFTQREQRKQIERLKQDYDYVEIGLVNISVKDRTELNEVSVDVSIPVTIKGPVVVESISRMFKVTKLPKIIDRNDIECDLFNKKLYLFKNSTLFTDDPKRVINSTADNNDKYSLETWLTLKKSSDSTCGDGMLLKNVTADDFEVTKVPLEELIPDQFK